MMTTEKRSKLIRTIESCSYLLLFISILSIFDGINRYLELMSHFKNQFFYSSVIVFVLLLINKRIKTATIAIFSMAINGLFIAPLYFSPFDQNQAHNDDGFSIKIVLSNVYTNNKEYEKLLKLIRQESPDIIVLQEVDFRWLKNISELKKHYPHNIFQPRDDNFGIAVLSKIESIEQRIVNWGNADVPSVESHFQINGHDFHLLATHPLPPVNAEYYALRNSQLSDVSARAKTIEGPKILAGDLNITTWSGDYKMLEKETGLANARYGFGTLPTWPVQMPLLMIPIDHALVSEEFQVTNVKTGPDIGSDHLPLIVDLKIR